MPLNQPADFVELNRQFESLEPTNRPEDAALRSYTQTLLAHEGGTGWGDILRNRIVVILGEPGSGKTWEFREQARLRSAAGEFAFFIPLDPLTTQSLDTVLGSQAIRQFRTWRRSGRDGTFFLDSVDEAKLRRPADFYIALDRLRDAIGDGSLPRARIVLSSRISEWQPETDRTELASRFALQQQPTERALEGQIIKSAISSPEPILIVELEPLDRTRVERFVRARGVPSPEGLVAALDEAHAWEFARRPLDVVELARFWSDRGRLGSLTELIELTVDSNTRETSARERCDPLSIEKARAGVETLAAATIFTRQLNFRVPDSASLAPDALNAQSCLPADWRPDESRALLERPIFDGASYGRIRFHHRRVGEYLAAQWLQTRLRNGCPIDELDRLLFEQRDSGRIIRPTLAPIAAWLCCSTDPYGEDLRRWVLQAAPAIHLQYGDPSGLPLEYKRQVLHALVERFTGRKSVWLESDPEFLNRLADPTLATDISAIIRDQSAASDLRAEMMQLVRYGRLQGSLPAALDILASPAEPLSLRCYAAAAVRDAGDDVSRQRLADIATALPDIPNSLGAILCEALYPSTIAPRQLVDMLRKSGPVPEFGVDIPYFLRSQIENVLPPEQAAALLYELLELAQTPPHAPLPNEPAIVSDQFSWVATVIPAVLQKLLQKPSLDPPEIAATAAALRYVGIAHQLPGFHRECPDLNSATNRHPSVRREYFWLLVNDWRRHHSETPRYMLQIFGYRELLNPDVGDVLWLLDDIRDRTDAADRELAVRFATELWNQSGRGHRTRHQLMKLVSGSEALEAAFRQAEMSGRFPRLRRFWYRQAKLMQRWWWEHRFSELQWQLKNLRGQWRLLTHIRLLASGRAISWLAQLAFEANEGHDTNQLGPISWQRLQAKRTRIVAWAARRGCERAWPHFLPLLPYEKENPSSIDNRVVAGLAGLQSAITSGVLDFSKISEDDARRVMHYAVNELNGFPSWFDDLVTQQPAIVEDVLSKCVQGEWLFPVDRKHAHEVVADIAWRGGNLAPLVTPTILTLLTTGDPPNDSVLHDVLTILLRNPQLNRRVLASTARSRARTYSPDSQRFLLWLAILLQLDAQDAIAVLEASLTRSPAPDTLMTRVASALNSAPGGFERAPTIANPDYLNADHLARFIPIVYRHVRVQDDIDRVGSGVYSPEARDGAQNFRNGLLVQLASIQTPRAREVLSELRSDIALVDMRDWISHLIDQLDETLAELAPWTSGDVRSFATEHEIEPKTDTDLFRIALKRMMDIKLDAEKSDNSLREEVRAGDKEEVLRRWLARKLNDRSRNRYTVPQEAEIDQRERPDLRIENPKTASVSIEIKWAHNWTLAELLDGLEVQLVGQYLRAHSARYAIYTLGIIGPERRWRGPDGRMLSFQEVVAIIRSRAQELQRTRAELNGIEVVSVDFRDPTSTQTAR